MKLIKYILLFFSFFVIYSCSNDDSLEFSEDKSLLEDAKLEIIEGNNQSGYLGDKLDKEIIIKASPIGDVEKYLVKYEIINEEGNITLTDYFASFDDKYLLNKNDEFRFFWSLGCNEVDQKIKITLYTDSLKYSDNYYIYHKRPSYELTVSASATKPEGWAKACGCEYIDYYSKIVSFDNRTLYLVGRGILFSEDGGINWKEAKDIPYNEDVADISFNSKGWAYITTKNNGIFYSKNMKDWIAINNGFLDYRDPTSFYVDDEILLVSFYFGGIYISTDNGTFWRKLLVGDSPNKFISRHPNGDLYFWDKWTRCYKSSDLGQTWDWVNINYKYIHSEIADFKIDTQGLLYIGSGDATISIIDPITYEGETHRYYEWNASSQTINNITITNNDVLYLVNGHPKSGLYSRKNNWQYLDLNFPYRIYNYYLKSDNTHILFSGEGLYYFSK